MLRLVLLGRPGAGKGTQGAFISEKFKVPRLIMSELLKEEVRSGSELGETIKGYMERGLLVPDDIVYRVLEKRLSEAMEKGFVLDGFPRNLEQAEWLEKFLNARRRSLTAVLFFDVDELTVLRRMMGRLVCESCGRSYNVFYDPPPDARRCECGGKLYQRSDDCYEKILRRLDVFNKETSPLIKYYEDKGLLVRIDASKDVEGVRKEVFSIISSLLSPF
ncbi:MAG: nucleoside monophosphate kinase [Candidatus Korarchaeota archaeon]|nr:nucleoside monophosphate kinase [Candidatus Korarchaeota archaeon]